MSNYGELGISMVCLSNINRKLRDVDVLIKNYHVRAEKRIINNKSTSAFYRHVNRKLDHCQRIPPIKAANGYILIKDRDKVEEFNEFLRLYSSIVTHCRVLT